MDVENCHVFRRRDVRPIKRRRVDDSGLEKSLETRLAAFRAIWSNKQQRIDGVIRGACAVTLNDTDMFLEESQQSRELHNKLPVAVLHTGHGSSAGNVLFDQLCEHLSKDENDLCVQVDASHGQNLRVFLSNLIRAATRSGHSISGDDDEQFAPLSKGPRLLRYDLQVLYDWCRPRNISRVTVAVPDGDSLDPGLLNDMIMLFRSWQDRLRFSLLLGVSTPLEIFHDRLSYSTTHVIESRLIKAVPTSDISSELFESLCLDSRTACRLGPNLSESLIRRQMDFELPVESFVGSIKYAYMSHFFGNPLSVLLSPSVSGKKIDELHCEAIRTLASFKRHIDGLVAEGEFDKVKDLLDSDTLLLQEVEDQLQASRNFIAWKLGACRLIRMTMKDIGLPRLPNEMDSYANALSGHFCSPGFRREFMLYLRKAPIAILSALSIKAKDILTALPPSNVEISPDEFSDMAESLTQDANEEERRRLQDSSGIKSTASGPRTQVKASQPGVKESFCELLAKLFDRTLQPYTTIFLHEVLFYDNRSPYTETFMPRTVSAIERALSDPKHYLGCNCCVAGEGSLRPTNPPTAILFQLFVESGALINVHDLLSAFKSILEKTVDDEQRLMALFYRGLAELKSLGLVKHSRRRLDHIAKLSWKGL